MWSPYGVGRGFSVRDDCATSLTVFASKLKDITTSEMAKHRHGKAKYLSNANITAPFPFLSLPREIRDCIYRLLLLTRYNYIETQGLWYYQLSPAILLACQQTADEGRKILFTENEFIILKLGLRSNFTNAGQYQLRYDWTSLNLAFLNIPIFSGLSETKINPVLRINVLTREKDYRLFTDHVTLVTTPEGIDRVMELMWCCARIGGFGDDASFELHFHHLVSSRRRYFNEHVLKPWGEVQGFRDARIDGVDADVSQHLIERLSQGPQLIDVIRRMEDIASRAKSAFDRKYYETALHHWDHMQKYWYYRYHLLRRSLFDDGPGDPMLKSLEATLPLMMKARLGAALSSLHLQHSRAYLDVLMFAEFTVEWAQSIVDVCELEYQLNPVLEMKLYVCCLLAHLARGNTALEKKALENAVSALSRIERFNDTNLDEFYWARDRYLKQTKATWRNSRNQDTVEQLRVRNYHLGLECRSFWDLLEIPEGA